MRSAEFRAQGTLVQRGQQGKRDHPARGLDAKFLPVFPIFVVKYEPSATPGESIESSSRDPCSIGGKRKTGDDRAMQDAGCTFAKLWNGHVILPKREG